MFRDRYSRRPPQVTTIVTLVAAMALALSACQAAATPVPATVAPATAAPATAAPATAAPASPSTATGPKSGGTFTMARSGDVLGWDPIHTDDLSSHAQKLVFATLAKPNLTGTDWDPDLASSWDIAPDGMSIVYHLRPGLKFSDGTPLTAKDVAFSAHRFVYDPESGAGASFPKGVDFVAVDAVTLKVTTPAPAPELFGNASYVSVYPEAYFTSKGVEGFASAPIGAGPFTMAEWDRGTKIVLKKNPNYWDQPKPYLDEVDLLVVADANTRAQKLQAGEVDASLDLPLNQIVTLKTDPNIKIFSGPAAAAEAIELNESNPNEPWFKDVNVRQAMNYAIDKDAIIKNVAAGFGSPMTTFLTAGPFVDPNGKPWPFDVTMAKSLMAKSKYASGFSTTLTVVSGNALEEGMATIVQAQLAAIGIKVTIQPLDVAAQTQLVQGPDGAGTDKYAMAFITYTNDSLLQGGIFRFCCIFNVAKRHSGWTFYNNDQLNAMWASAQTEPDQTKRAALFAQMQQIAWNDAPYVALFNPQVVAATRANVHDFVILPTVYDPLDATWKE